VRSATEKGNVMRLRIVIGVIWLASLVAAFWIGRASVSEPTTPPSPVPTFPNIGLVKAEFVGTEYGLYTLRNHGAAGDVFISLMQANRSWTFRTTFNAGDERQVRFDLPGLQPLQTVSINIIPVAQASSVQIQGAVLPK
jgi:hypothetical protein